MRATVPLYHVLVSGSLSFADYALLSDCHSAALVTRDGSVEWLCFPRFDRPSVFGRLLDDDAGHWSLRPVADAEITRRYVDDILTALTKPQSGEVGCHVRRQIDGRVTDFVEELLRDRFDVDRTSRS